MQSIETINEYILSEVTKIKSLPPGSFTIDSHIIYDLYFDSVDLIDLLTAIEDDLNVVIADDKLEKFTTLSSISQTILHCSSC
ncbi:acyl carrier protein [Citrobacter sp. Marseille-Q6884]|uniref:acyl carrier protein n=1 Tax=Citrobacter sp. Marseille-Q6884 TaxID=2956786 RepID=UPI00391EE404